jgi:hypothetical protein
MDITRVSSAFQARAASMNPNLAMNESVSRYVGIFSQALVESCSPNELDAITDFLTQHVWAQVREDNLWPSFEEKLQKFLNEEPQLSGLDSQKLVKHSGPLDAVLGVILHVNHYPPEDEEHYIPGPFWNLHNRSIQQFAQKGFSDNFTFGMDWHWRAAPRANNYPMYKWGSELRAYHDKFSASILDLLPCQLLVVSGACAWESYKQSIIQSSKHLSFTFEDVTMDVILEFEKARNVLRRITLQTDHPAYGFWNPFSAPIAATRFDAQCNFALWLAGQPFVERSQQLVIQNHQRGKPGSAPFDKLWEYRALEANLGRNLKLEDIDLGFLYWAGRYLKRDFSQILNNGESVIELLVAEYRRRLSDSTTAHSAAKWGEAFTQGFKRTVNRRTSNDRVSFDLTVRRIKIKVPYLSEDHDALKRLKSLEVYVKMDFEVDNILASACIPNARPSESAFGLRIQCSYEIQDGTKSQARALWVTQDKATDTHTYLCKMNSLADFVMGKEKADTLSHTHRYISKSLYKREENIKGDCYTICQEDICQGCATIKRSMAWITPIKGK